MSRQDPTIARFLRRHPQLGEAVAKAQAGAADVRAAKRRALPENDEHRPSQQQLDARRELFAAVGALERLASSSREEIGAAVDRVMVSAMEMRVASHALSPRRTTTSPAARAELFRGLAAFEDAFADLEKQARAGHVRQIPWQIELATHVAPGTPVREMEIRGYELPRTPAARRPWGERCFLSGTAFNTDRHAAPALRYRSLDSCSHTLAPEYHELFGRLRSALDRLSPDRADRIIRLLPSLAEDYVAETSSPGFARLGLLDFPSLAVSLNNMFRAFAHRPLFGTRAADGYVWETFDEVRTLALRLARGFERLGLAPGARIGILTSGSGREFYLADFAAIFAGLVSVGLSDTLSDGEIFALTARAKLDALVVDPTYRDRLQGRELPGILDLEKLLAADLPDSWTSASGVSPATGIVYGDEAGYGEAEAWGLAADGEDDLYTVLFTSGSTGSPKGTRVTRRRWAEEMVFPADVWPHVSVSFQAPSVAADRGLVWRTLSGGGRVGFARRGAGLFDDARAVRPTIFDAPPVVWNTLYAEYRRAIDDPALTRGEAARVRRRFRDSLGGRLVFMAVGGAPSDPGVRGTMESLFDIPMTESYGTTETGNIAADGELLPGLDYRLVDLPELGFTAADQPFPRGELAVRTPHTTAGYLGGADEGYTADGYFLTGDIVEIGPGRKCTIVGRRKQFFKLAGSEFVCPAELERLYMTSELVEAVLITGSPLESAVVAVTVPSADGVGEGEILADFRAIAQRAALRPGEIPAGVVVEPLVDGRLPWNEDNGLLTASLKLNRQALEKRYRGDVEAVYARSRTARAAVDERPGTRLEDVKRIAAALLSRSVADVDVRRSFLENGGDSMAAMEFVLRLEQVFSGKGGDGGVFDAGELVEASLEEVARRIAEPSPPSPLSQGEPEWR